MTNKIRHGDVGQGLESVAEWQGDDLHEVIGGGDIIISNPPSTFHKIYNLYAKKVGATYHLMMEVESVSEP